MRLRSRNIILFLGIILVIVALSIYFFWQSDTLIKFVPENSFLYLHLDLNQARRTGCLGNQWLNDLKIQQILTSLSENDSRLALIKNTLKRENIGFIDEVALVLSPRERIYENDKEFLSEMETILFLRLKRWANPSLLIKSLKGFHVKELTTRVWAISPQPFLNNFKSSDFFLPQDFIKKKDPLFSRVGSLVWAKGYINFEDLRGEIKEESEINKRKNNLAEISLYSVSSAENLFFSINLPKQDYKENLFSFDDFILDNNFDQGYVFILPQIKSTDFLLQKIKQALAVQNPTKKQVLLPDQTKFTELIVDLNNFNFKTEELNETIIHYWPMDFFENQQQAGFIVWKDKEQNFVTNKISLFKEIVDTPNKLFSGFQIQEIERGVFFQNNKLPLENLLIIQTEQGTKGRLNLGL